MKIFFLLLYGVVLFGDITIEEAWHRVQTHNNAIKASQSDLQSAHHKADSAKSMYLPNISLTGSYTHMDKPIDLDTSDISALMSLFNIPFPTSIDLSKKDIFLADLQLLWPLYVGGRIDAAQDIYHAKVQESKARVSMKSDEEFLKLIRYYYGSVVAKSLYTTRNEMYKALTLHYDDAKKLYENAQIAKVELLHAKVQQESARIESLKAKHKYEIAQEALKLLIKTSQNPSSQLFINRGNKEENDYVDETTKNYSALALLDAKEKQATSLVAVKKAAYLPTVTGFANYNLYRDNTPLMKSLPNWFAGIMVNINLLQRSDRAQEVQIAKLTDAKVKYLKAEAIENLKLLVKKSYKEMMANAEEFNALTSSLALAEENFKLRSLSFKEGLTTSVAVVDAQILLQGVKTKQLNAAYNYVLNLAQLAVLGGKREKFFEATRNAIFIK